MWRQHVNVILVTRKSVFWIKSSNETLTAFMVYNLHSQKGLLKIPKIPLSTYCCTVYVTLTWIYSFPTRSTSTTSLYCRVNSPTTCIHMSLQMNVLATYSVYVPFSCSVYVPPPQWTPHLEGLPTYSVYGPPSHCTPYLLSLRPTLQCTLSYSVYVPLLDVLLTYSVNFLRPSVYYPLMQSTSHLFSVLALVSLRSTTSMYGYSKVF